MSFDVSLLKNHNIIKFKDFMMSKKFDSIITNVAIDSRLVQSNGLFIALKGERTDGHLHILNAIENGATCIMVENISQEIKKIVNNSDISLIITDDCIKSLGELASWRRDSLNAKVVGITGSIGKTTVKEIVAAVLSTKYKVHYTIGNLNNHIGLPLIILNTPNDVDILVLEMGMNHSGEISYLSNIAKPDISIITNISPVHIGHFKNGIKGIIEAKCEIFDYMNKDGFTIINQDNKYHEEIYQKAQKVGLKKRILYQ